MTYVDLPPDEHRPAQVQLAHGVWCDGYLESYSSGRGRVVGGRALLDRAGSRAWL
jgi:hypothetical protein